MHNTFWKKESSTSLKDLHVTLQLILFNWTFLSTESVCWYGRPLLIRIVLRCECEYACLFVSLCWSCDELIQGGSCRSPKSSWDRLHPPHPHPPWPWEQQWEDGRSLNGCNEGRPELWGLPCPQCSSVIFAIRTKSFTSVCERHFCLHVARLCACVCVCVCVFAG